jgi:hypothetical protein
MRSDAFKNRTSDRCQKCSALYYGKQFVSSHNLDTTHPIYKRWCAMKGRCNSKSKAKWYRDKGIIVCDEWLYYENFYHWSLNNGFNEKLELDRIDENKNYCPENCQWITHRENILKIKNLFGKII